jgi:hypothetical protein
MLAPDADLTVHAPGAKGLHRDFRLGYFVQIWSPDEFHGDFVPSLPLVRLALQPYSGGTSFQRIVSWHMKLAEY